MNNRTNSPWRILVVDHSSDFRLLCVDALTHRGCRVDVAENGATAWKSLQAHHYHLLIAENNMPNSTGDELIGKLLAARMDVPVIMVTGSIPDREPARNPPLPFAAILRRPFALDTLLRTVKDILPEAEPSRALLPPSSDDAGRPMAVALSVHGKCEYGEDMVQFSKLERGHILKQGDIVRTGDDARADLLLRRSGTSIRLQAGTEIRLEKITLAIKDGLTVVHTLLSLHAGRLFTVVHATVTGTTLEIRNAASRSVAEGSGVSKCIITADEAHIWAQGSAIPIRVRGEKGSAIIAAERPPAEMGEAIRSGSKHGWVKDLVELDDLQAAVTSLNAKEQPPGP